MGDLYAVANTIDSWTTKWNISTYGQLELAPSGLVHYQVFVRTKTNYRWSTMVERLRLPDNKKIFVDLARNVDAILKYVKKTDTRMTLEKLTELYDNRVDAIWLQTPCVEYLTCDFGEKIKFEQGKRKDVIGITDTLTRLCEQVPSLRKNEIRMQLIKLHGNEFARMHGGIERMLELSYKPRLPPLKGEPFKWQQQFMDMLADKPDDRTIHFLVGFLGGEGKSSLVNLLMHRFGPDAVLPLNGQPKDMYLIIKNNCDAMKMAVFDYSRACPAKEMDDGFIVAEKLKDGICTSSKYMSEALTFDVPHVVVICNRLPSRLDKVISEDRIRIHHVFAPRPRGSGEPTAIYNGRKGYDKFFKLQEEHYSEY
nr:MAG: hypothetical protein [Chemarfal virus 38]